MKVGLLVIGSEILDGKTTDTNTRFLAEFLKRNHSELHTTATVKDDEPAIHRGLHALFEVCDVVVTSGGLGPTKDDMTKHTLASYFGRMVSFSESAFKVASDNYERKGRSFAGIEHGYCYLPMGFEALSNSSGFAPGLFVHDNGKYLISGPGVPREFKSILEDHFVSRIAKNFHHEFLDVVTIRTKRIPEEKIFQEVDPTLWERLESFGDVSSLPKIIGVDITVNIKGKTQAELHAKKLSVLKIFDESPLKPNIWHTGTESIEQIILSHAKKKNKSFGFAESATGGLCSSRITDISGSSEFFIGGVVCYNTDVKTEMLGVNPQTIKLGSVYSTDTAKEMARGLREKLKTDIAISVTGLAGPTGGTEEYPVGSVSIGVATKNSVEAISYKFFGDREQLKMRFSQAALMTLLEELEKTAT